MKIKIETKTPIHIGNGLYYGLMESYLDKGYLVRVNMNTLFNENPQEAKLYTTAVTEKNLTMIQSILKKGGERYRLRLRGGTLKKIEDTINECVKDSSRDVPYIPGSSVKGFLRTALIAKYLKDNHWNFEFSVLGKVKTSNLWKAMENGIREINIRKLMIDREDYNQRRNKYIPKTLGRRFENLVVYIGNIGKGGPYFNYDAKYDIFKFLNVTDFYPDEYDMWVDAIRVVSGNKGPSDLYEVVMGKFSGSISLNPSIKTAISNKEYPLLKNKLKIFGLEENDLKDVSYAEERMIRYIKDALKEHINEIKNYETNTLHRHTKNYEGNMRLGFGTGFLYKTLWVYMANNLSFDILQKILTSLQYHGTPYTFPKSKHLLSNGEEPGWVFFGLFK